jgi:hypothetical protein
VLFFLLKGISDSPTLQNQRHQDQGGGECDARLPEGTSETLQAKMNGDAAHLTALKDATHELIKITKVKSSDKLFIS